MWSSAGSRGQTVQGASGVSSGRLTAGIALVYSIARVPTGWSSD
jgi:hypothetical protein